MSNTLRRKMFKLGGSTNTHGIGITSGLKMNKGGRVGFQPGGAVTRGGPFSRPTPFIQFGGSSEFAPLSEQLQPTKEALARLTGGGILQSLGLAADPNFQIGQNLPQEGGFLSPGSFVTSEQLRQNLLQQSINADKTNIATDETGSYKPMYTYNETGDPVGLTERGETSAKSLVGDTAAKTLKDELTKADEAPAPEETPPAPDEGTEDIDGDDAVSLEDEANFEEKVRERSAIIQDLLETDSKAGIGAQALLAGSAKLLEGKGAESYAEAAQVVGDVLTNKAKEMRTMRNLATTQAIKDVTAAETAEALAESKLELYKQSFQQKLDELGIVDAKTRLGLISAFAEATGDPSEGADAAFVTEANLETPGKLRTIPRDPKDPKQVDVDALIPGTVYYSQGKYYATDKNGLFSEALTNYESALQFTQTGG